MIFEKEGFKFGMYASAISQKIAGCSLGELFKRMQVESEASLALLHYFYGGAVAFNESKGLPAPNIDHVGDMIESIGIEKAMSIFNESLQMPKNSEAPKETGQM